MASSRIALVVLTIVLGATAAFSQDEQEAPAPTQSPASDSSQSNAPAAKPVRVPGNVASAMLIHQVAPVYPAAAKEQHIEGTVVLHALIGKDGTLRALRYVSGPPALMQSAMEAVKQWQYKPTLLNGEPVDVDTTISVVYTLGGKTLADATESSPAPHGSDTSSADAFAPSPSRTRVAADVAAAQLVHQVSPVYPPIAKTAHISGTVVLRVIIAKDGTIKDLQYVSGPPLLMKSAMDAVRQWIYRPTLVNGDPAEVDTTVSVVYTLGGRNPNDVGGSGTTSDVPGSPAEAPTATALNASQDSQKDPATTQTPASASSQPNSPAPKPKLKRIRVGGTVASANLIHQVAPVYPKDAKKQHISGTVLLHATIGHDGTVENLEYVSGPTELTTSAMQAVKQWRYKPALLNGDPVEVDTTISVVYTLSGN